jgi:hypothetical protein
MTRHVFLVIGTQIHLFYSSFSILFSKKLVARVRIGLNRHNASNYSFDKKGSHHKTLSLWRQIFCLIRCSILYLNTSVLSEKNNNLLRLPLINVKLHDAGSPHDESGKSGFLVKKPVWRSFDTSNRSYGSNDVLFHSTSLRITTGPKHLWRAQLLLVVPVGKSLSFDTWTTITGSLEKVC